MEGLFSWGAPAAAAFIISLTLTPFVRKLAFVVGAVDNPNSRKVHEKKMPRLGGVAIFLAFAAGVVFFQPLGRSEIGLLLGCALIVITGIIDDIWELPAKVKLAAQIGAAGVLVAFGVRVDFITDPLGGLIHLNQWAVPLTILWVIGVTNAVNLIDGLDGLAAGTSAIAAVVMAAVAFGEGQFAAAGLAVILACSVLGFLPFNFYPAKMFMGDSGSMFLGFTLGALAVEGLTKGTTFISVFLPVIILGIPLLDTLFAVIRRYINHRPIFEPDREHLHHLFLEMGFSHRKTVLTIYGIDIFLGLSAVVLNILSTEQSIAALILLVTAIAVGVDRIGIFRRAGMPKCSRPSLKDQAKDYHSG